MSNERRVLVTGASGFIGSHLAERLVREGFHVRAFVHYNSAGNRFNLDLLDADIRREIEVVAGDICDPFVVDKAVASRDIVFHLASLIAIPYSYLAPAAFVTTNVIGALNLLQACRAHDVGRVIHTSTSEVYGTAQYTPMDEQHPLQGQSPYAASKIGADKLAESFHCSVGLPVATVRPFNTYGPRQSARAVIPTILSQLISGRKELRLGSLDTIRDFLFVTDTVDGFIAVARCDACVGKVTNLGTGRGVSIGDVARLAMEITGRTASIACEERRVRPENSEVTRLICDSSAALERCGWSAKRNLKEGLQAVADDIEAHPERFRSEDYAI